MADNIRGQFTEFYKSKGLKVVDCSIEDTTTINQIKCANCGKSFGASWTSNGENPKVFFCSAKCLREHKGEKDA